MSDPAPVGTMPHVRGSLFLNTFAFLRELKGTEAPDDVLRSLQPEVRARVDRRIQESSWHDFADLMAYMRAAKALFGVDDPQFFRRMGYFSGQAQRRHGGFDVMVPEPAISVQMGRFIWRALYDTGRAEVRSERDRVALASIYDFPADAVHCERVCGALEGLLSSDVNVARATELQCTASGAPHCEIRVRWL